MKWQPTHIGPHTEAHTPRARARRVLHTTCLLVLVVLFVTVLVAAEQ